ncbi:NUDIX domain-containing protein [Rhodopila sp.]|uniref:NUDIX hydrolase n=1 Tax=Rhodopila sp. TaxID=2480087 RepID=UPI003D0E9BB8
MDQDLTETGFERHVRACNNARLPGDKCAIRIGQAQVGWASPAIASALRGFDVIRPSVDGLTVVDPDALPRIARTLSERGMFGNRNEMFDVRADPLGPALAQIDRGALPSFGIQALGVHVNGLVQRPEGLHVWIARRAKTKALDPGKLDHVVAGGVPAGLGRLETLIKEAGEEASIPPALAARATEASVLDYTMERAEGLRRDFLYCYDLNLPSDFTPVAADGEVEAFELWPVERVMDTVRTTNAFKFNVNLVLIDLFIRQGLIAGAEAKSLSAALAPA